MAVVGAAIAFAIAGAVTQEVVKKIDGKDKTMKELAIERDKWLKERQTKLDRLNERLVQIHQSDIKFKELDAALRYYRNINGGSVPNEFLMDRPYPNNSSGGDFKKLAVVVSIASGGMYLWKTMK